MNKSVNQKIWYKIFDVKVINTQKIILYHFQCTHLAFLTWRTGTWLCLWQTNKAPFEVPVDPSFLSICLNISSREESNKQIVISNSKVNFCWVTHVDGYTENLSI